MKTKILLLIIFIVSLFLRIYKINSYPPLLWDEAALGYNAYSILETGKDEYGKTLPLIFTSFGDYKPGLYVYLAVPFVKLFGLNELSVRLPSIILGSLIPILLYLLIINIDKNKYKLATIAAWIACFNPYNIHYSRGSWETNIITFEIILISLLFFQKKYLFSGIVLGLSLYTYQSGKMLGILLIFILLILSHNTHKFPFLKNKKLLFLHFKNIIFKFFIPIFILSLPIAYGLLFSKDSNRLKVVSLFSYPRSTKEQTQIIAESNILDYQIFHGQTTYFLRNALTRYFNHFSPEFLAIKGDWQNPRHSAPYIGVILYPSLFFLVIGLFISKYKEPINLFFLLLLLLAPIPAALTRDTIQATRSMWMSIGLIYFIAIGIEYITAKYKSVFLNLFILGLYLLSFIYYSDLYLNHMVKTHSPDWLWGYKESTQYLIKKENQYENIYMTNFYGQPYIYYLFYSKYPPMTYQKTATITSNSLDTGSVDKIGKIHFTSPNFSEISQMNNVFAVFSYDEVVRQNLDFKLFKQFGNFYIYEKS